MKKVYIIQTHSETVPSQLVRLFTKNKYTHISISLNKKMNKMYSFGRRHINNMLNSGFIIESIDGDFYKKFSKTKCKIFELEITSIQYYRLKKILKKYEADPLRYNYDILGLLIKKLNIGIKRKNKFVCSQFVGFLLEETKICDFDKDIYYLIPSDFNNISNNIIYEGVLKEYI